MTTIHTANQQQLHTRQLKTSNNVVTFDNGYWVFSPGLKRSGRGIDHSPTSSAEIKERVELYFFSSTKPSWKFAG